MHTLVHPLSPWSATFPPYTVKSQILKMDEIFVTQMAAGFLSAVRERMRPTCIMEDSALPRLSTGSAAQSCLMEVKMW